jgi:Zn-dependent protease with chaperone function
MARHSKVVEMSALFLLVAAPAAVMAQGKPESFEGYAEWRQGQEIIIDGQRVRATASTKFKGTGDAKEFTSIPLGYEVKVSGTRKPDGTVEATSVEAKPNGTAMFEAETLTATQQLEASFLAKGFVPAQPEPHRLLKQGPDVDRVKRIALRLVPSYKSKDDFRFYVVEDREWNAFACANGMIVVNQGLLHDMDDDEVALVLGHELVHATHEHSRKGRKKDLFIGVLSQGGGAAAASATGGRTQAAAVTAIGLTGLAASNGYGREMEDQADRVGLRYAYEAGFDVTKGPRLWQRFGEKYPARSGVHNFFFSDHSLSAARAENLRRQVALNYPQLVDQLNAAESAPAGPERNAGDSSKASLKKELAPNGPNIDLWVDRAYSSWDNPLESELTVNGQLVDVFTSDRRSPLGEYLKAGWNTVAIKTTPHAPATQGNGLRFRLGPAAPGARRGEHVMKPVLWEFRNDTDWSLSDGEFRHRLGPNVKDITLSFPLYFAGLDQETAEPKAGDYILGGKPHSDSWTAPVTATVFVNGTPLNTFTSKPRDVVITSLLRAGRNEITLVSSRVAGVVQDNDIEFTLFGPVEWDVQQKTFVGPKVVQFSSMQGWKRDAKTGTLTNAGAATADKIERVIPLVLKEAPAVSR